MSDVDYKKLLTLESRVFVVLGAGQGIGEEVVGALSQCGARVICVDSVPERAERVAAAFGGIAIAADVTRREDMERVFLEAAKVSAAGPLGLVDIVGMIVRNELGSDDENWKRQFEINLDHAWLALRYGSRAMKGRGGSMVFMGSIAGNVVRAGHALGYASSKAALHHLVRCAALELAPLGIRVNAVAPGLSRTPRLCQLNPDSFWKEEGARIPMGRTGEMSDIASAVLYLSSPMASYVTGHIISVDGGTALVTGGGFKLAVSS